MAIYQGIGRRPDALWSESTRFRHGRSFRTRRRACLSACGFLPLLPGRPECAKPGSCHPPPHLPTVQRSGHSHPATGARRPGGIEKIMMPVHAPCHAVAGTGDKTRLWHALPLPCTLLGIRAGPSQDKTRLWHALPLPSAWHMRADRMREACRLRLNPGVPPCRQQ